MTMTARMTRILIYTKDVEKMANFYIEFFGFKLHQEEGDRITELIAPDGGANILLHKAAKTTKMGQVLVKLVFDVEDIQAFCTESAAKGLKFGSIHKADGYSYANAKDPSKNSIQISSRAFKEL